jgi:hypothetical protein
MAEEQFDAIVGYTDEVTRDMQHICEENVLVE